MSNPTNPTKPNRLRRSELATPGSSPKMIAKAAASSADLVFLDLEDAVAPINKVSARANIIAGLNELDWGNTTRAVRINEVGSQWCHQEVIDLVTQAGANIDIIIIPKIRSPRDVWYVDTLLTELEAGLDLPHRIGLEVLIEEVEALSRVDEIALCCDRLEALILGVGDLAASQGLRLGHIGTGGAYPGDIWHYARARMVVAARAAGIDAVDGPYSNFGDPEGYRQEAGWATTLGCVGKWAIHPSQIDIAHEVFSPTEKEVSQAQAVIDAVKKAEGEGSGAASLGGFMIDAATARVFQVTLDRQAQIDTRTA